MFIRPLIAPLTAGALLAAGTAPALGQNASSVEIRTADLNLESAAGRTTLERRISNAERQLCEQITSGSRVQIMQYEQECRAEVRRQAHAQFPSLSRNG